MKGRIIILLFLLIGGLPAQTLSRLENRLKEQTVRLQRQMAVTDSLQTELRQLTVQLEAEKGRPKPDQKKLKRLMAGIVELSRRLGQSREQEQALQTAMQEIRRALEAAYSRKIDSLQAVLQKEKFRGNRSDLQQEILRYSEKRLAVAPPLPGLRFDPGKIAQIAPTSARDSTERLIYTDYLRRALQDVDQHLKRLQELRQEYQAAWQLRRRTRDFVDDVTSDGEVGVLGISPGRSTSPLSAGRENFQGRTQTALSTTPQMQSVLSLYSQLESQNRWQIISPDSGRSVLSPEEYLRMLQETIRQLKHYREVIVGKLEKIAPKSPER